MTAVLSPRTADPGLGPDDVHAVLRSSILADGFDFVVADGVSANRYPKADLSRTIARMGYRPLDDAWECGDGTPELR